MASPQNLSHAPFTATRWSVVAAAGDLADAPAARRALGELAQTYWPPLYAFLRRQGLAPAQAEDLVQAFFARLIETEGLRDLDRTKGRFRSFLLASIKHFLLNHLDREHALKRGGGARLIALDAFSAESRLALEPADHLTPERAFERQWALSVLAAVMTRLRQESEAAGKGPLFDDLKPALTGEGLTYVDIGQKHGLSISGVKMAVHRLKKRYRELLRAEIAQTVAGDEAVEDEIQYLLNCL